MFHGRPLVANSTSRSARDRILDAAAGLIARRGYHNANIDEIIQQSGTSKGSFYFHFPSKEKMVFGLLDQLSAKLVRRVEGSIERETRPVQRIASAIDSLLLTFSRQRKLGQILLINVVGQGRAMDKKFLPIRDRFAQFIQRELDRAVDAGAVPPLDTELVSHVWLGALHEVVLRWLLASQPTPIMDTASALRTMLLRSIGVEMDEEPGALTPSAKWQRDGDSDKG